MLAKILTFFACLALVQSELIRVPLKMVKSARQTGRKPEFNGKRQSLLGKYQTGSSLYGQVRIGTPPQNFTFLFDTCSSDTFVVSSKCSSVYCIYEDRYYSSKSSTYKPNGTYYETNFDRLFGPELKGIYKESSTYIGFLSYDTVQVGDIAVTDQLFAEITKERTYIDRFAGHLGLSYQSVSNNTLPMVMTNLFAQHPNLEPLFSIELNDVDGETLGDMTIGGVAPVYNPNDFIYVPVVKNQPLWKIKIDQIIIGSDSVIFDNSSPNLAVIDTGSNGIKGPTKEIKKIHNILRDGDSSEFLKSTDCQDYELNLYPEITFVLNGQNLTLAPRDYMDWNHDAMCAALFYELDVDEDQGSWILGATFIKAFYTQFDYKNSRVGFTDFK